MRNSTRHKSKFYLITRLLATRLAAAAARDAAHTRDTASQLSKERSRKAC